MQTILDVSLLGQGYYHEKSRTGVFRVAENLALNLPKISEDLEILFADSLDLTATLAYVNQYLDSDNAHFVNENSQLFFAGLQQKILSNFPLNSLPQKALKKIFYKLSSNGIDFSKEKMQAADLFHSAYFPFPAQIQKQTKIKKLITIYDLIPILYPQFFQNRTDNVVHKIINSITPDTFAVCISENTKKDLQEKTHLPDSQVFVVPLAASREIFYQEKNTVLIQNILTRYNVPEGAKYVLSIATLEPRKNIDTLIKSFVQLITEQNIKDLYLILVGTKGWDFDKIFEEFNISGIVKERIIFTGYVSDAMLAPLYSGAMTFVYMSHYEGFGLPVLEAMQCGTAVICSNTSSLPEVIGGKEKTAIMLAPTDVENISQAIFTFYKDGKLCDEYAQNGLKRSADFSWQKFANDNYEVYKSIV
jgi:glycosyltransferase involved in cell wall biosynthesis